MATKNPVIARAEKAYAEQAAPAAGATPAAPGQVQGGPGTLPPGSPADLQANFNQQERAGGSTAAMTLHDVIMKSLLLFGVLVLVSVISWTISAANPGMGMVFLFVGLIGGLILGLVNAFKREVSPPLVIAYAAFQGLLVGGISYWYQGFGEQYGMGNIVAVAVISTFVVFAVMLALYSKRIIKVNGKFKKIMMVALVSYLGLVVVAGITWFIRSMTGGAEGQMFLFGNGPIGIIISVIVVALAAFTLCMDFDAIEQGINYGVPERESWRMGFGLMVSLIWLYLEILRLLAIIASNR